MKLDIKDVGLHLFVRRLEARSTLSDPEREAVLSLRGQLERVAAHRDFVRVGEELRESCLIVEGLVARVAQLEDGGHQIISLHMPGDMVDPYSLMLPRALSALHALAKTTIRKVPHEALRAMVFAHQNLSAALWRDCVVDGAIVAQWLVNISRKSARSRIAHLMAEMAVRYG